MTDEGALSLAHRVNLGAPRCDPTANLYDTYHAVQGDTLRAPCPALPAAGPATVRHGLAVATGRWP